MRLFKALQARARAFGQDARGSMAIMFALTLGIMVFATGAAIDLTRMVLAKQLLQQATDSAAIAAVRIAMEAEADMSLPESFTPHVDAYLQANLNAATNQNTPVGMQPNVTTTLGPETLTVTAEVEVTPGLTSVFGIERLPVAASSSVRLPYAGYSGTSGILVSGG